MKVLRATQEQYEELDGYQNGVDVLVFAVDGNEDWIIGKGCLVNPAFEPILPQLQQLEEIDYVPPPPEEEE